MSTQLSEEDRERLARRQRAHRRRVRRRRRRLRRRLMWISAPILLVLLAAGFDAALVVRDFVRAHQAMGQLASGSAAGDGARVNEASWRFGDAMLDARRRTDRPWWTLASHLPWIGDRVDVVRALARSGATVSTQALPALTQVVPDLRAVLVDGRIDTERLRRLQAPSQQLSTAFGEADRDVAGVDGSILPGPAGRAASQAISLIRSARISSDAAAEATRVLPGLLGESGPQRYLVIFGNNAEVRSTGGLPGSWALLRADRGAIDMIDRGPASQIRRAPTPVAALRSSERRLYTDLLATDIRDTAFTPDVVRSAELQADLWRRSFPGVDLDGVIQIDTVGLSYLLDGSGPVDLGSVTLTRDNAVANLLSRAYERSGPASPDRFYSAAVGAVFSQLTQAPASLLGLLHGLDQASEESRLRVVGLTPQTRAALGDVRAARSVVDGDLGGIGPQARAMVTLDDATGAKMSYYLRARTTLSSTCDAGQPSMQGSTLLHQTIDPKLAARTLTDYVTGGGVHGVEPGHQAVVVRVYGPRGARAGSLRLNGRDVLDRAIRATWHGRPVLLLSVLLGDLDARLDWTFQVSPAAEYAVWQTPGVVPGAASSTTRGVC